MPELSLAPTAGWALVGADASGRVRVRPWAETLHHTDAALLEGRADRERQRQRLQAAFPEERLRQLAAAFEPWWPVRPKRTQGLDLVLVHPDGRRDKMVLYHRVVRIGRDASCQLQLHADTVSSQHCEIRLEEDKLWLVDLASSNGTRLNGFDLVAFEPRPLMPGDQVHIRPFRLVIGAPDVQFAPPRVAISLGEPLRAEGDVPFAALAGPHSLWVRVEASGRCGFLRLPASWLRYAYMALGYEPPAAPTAPFGNEVDLSLTSFLLQQIAAEVGQRTGIQPSLSAIVTPARVTSLVDPVVERWEGARFALLLGDERHEAEALWPAIASEGTPSPRPRPAWAEALSFSAAVSAGFLRLAAAELGAIDRGDILVPDRWLPVGFADQQSADLGPVLLYVQGSSCAADLRFEKGYYYLHVTSPWRVAPKGAAMAERDPMLATGMEGGPVRLPDELEALVSFELERISVPLKELLAWEPGATVRLQRTPDDPLRIVLRQGNEERLLGYGRVVVVDEKIGVQIERWLVEG